jgi:hypothetical protein
MSWGEERRDDERLFHKDITGYEECDYCEPKWDNKHIYLIRIWTC